MEKIFKKSERFFRQQLSNLVYDDLLKKLRAEEIYEFSEIMINKYYDVRYKEKVKTPLAVINSDNIKTAANELLELFSNQ